MSPDEALARQAIADLVARYNSYGDRGRWEQVRELFVPDAVMVVRRPGEPEQRHEGLDSIMSIFTGTAAVVESGRQPGAASFIRHLTATHVVDLVDADRATGRLYFQVLTAAGLDHWGRYSDRYLRVGGQWRFLERVATLEGWSSTSPFV
jgi:hypothetical protein